MRLSTNEIVTACSLASRPENATAGESLIDGMKMAYRDAPDSRPALGEMAMVYLLWKMRRMSINAIAGEVYGDRKTQTRQSIRRAYDEAFMRIATRDADLCRVYNRARWLLALDDDPATTGATT